MANHSDLPSAGSIFGSSQDSLMCVRISLSQDGFHPRGITPLLMSKELPNGEGFLDFKYEKYVVPYLLSGQGPASPLDCPATDISEFLSTGNELKLLSLGRVEGVGGMPQ